MKYRSLIAAALLSSVVQGSSVVQAEDVFENLRVIEPRCNRLAVIQWQPPMAFDQECWERAVMSTPRLEMLYQVINVRADLTALSWPKSQQTAETLANEGDYIVSLIMRWHNANIFYRDAPEQRKIDFAYFVRKCYLGRVRDRWRLGM